jgi:hypothetical protein
MRIDDNRLGRAHDHREVSLTDAQRVQLHGRKVIPLSCVVKGPGCEKAKKSGYLHSATDRSPLPMQSWVP